MSAQDDVVSVIDEAMKRDDLTGFEVSLLVLARQYLGPQPAKRPRRERTPAPPDAGGGS